MKNWSIGIRFLNPIFSPTKYFKEVQKISGIIQSRKMRNEDVSKCEKLHWFQICLQTGKHKTWLKIDILISNTKTQKERESV